MIAVSTFRPHSQSKEYARNQTRAVQSWSNIFEDIFLIGSPEPDLALPNVIFIDSGEKFPTIKDMVLLLTRSKDWGCWINCDIVLTPTINKVLEDMPRCGAWAVTSQRWTFDADTFDLWRAKVEPNDFGLDIFITTGLIWNRMYPLIHPGLRKAGMMYDTWMTGYFVRTLGDSYRNFTGYRCVFHPRHEGRQQEQHNKMEWVQDQYGRAARIPFPLQSQIQRSRV